MSAAGAGHTDCVRLLLEAGADKKARDEVRDINTFCDSSHHFNMAPDCAS